MAATHSLLSFLSESCQTIFHCDSSFLSINHQMGKQQFKKKKKKKKKKKWKVKTNEKGS